MYQAPAPGIDSDICIQQIFGEGENVDVFGSLTVHSVNLDKTFTTSLFHPCGGAGWPDHLQAVPEGHLWHRFDLSSRWYLDISG